jgi:hypothetical protein
MKPFLLSATVLFFSATLTCAPVSSTSRPQSQPDATKPATQSSASAQSAAPANAAPDKDKQDKIKNKPKKVWTNDELSTVSGGISVVGDSSASAPVPRNSPDANASAEVSTKDKQAASYRDQLRQLHAQLQATDKKISDTQNFKADNTSSSGGINMNKGYTMTPIEDQIKQLEEKRKQIQSKIDAVEDEARKNGVEPGQLR